MIGNLGSNLNPFGAATAKLRTESAKIGPDGKLYVTFFQSGHIYRVTNPRTPSPIPPGTLKLELVGQSDNDKRLVSQAWIGNDLWVVQAGFVERIVNATACNPTGTSLSVALQCVAKMQWQNQQFPMGLASTVLPDWPIGRRAAGCTSATVDALFARISSQGAFLSGNSSSFQIWTQGGTIPPSAFHVVLCFAPRSEYRSRDQVTYSSLTMHIEAPFARSCCSACAETAGRGCFPLCPPTRPALRQPNLASLTAQLEPVRR